MNKRKRRNRGLNFLGRIAEALEKPTLEFEYPVPSKEERMAYVKATYKSIIGEKPSLENFVEIIDDATAVTHSMNLNPAPFDAIKNGRKNVEMRLNDEKRQGIAAGDYILFTETDTKEELLVRVVDKIAYPSFKELYEHHDKTTIGYTADEEAHPDDMLEYYTADNIKRYGALAIVIEVVNN